jgi:hypothetical protein
MISQPATDGDLELLRWMHKSGEVDLGMITELGTSCAYLAVLHDRKDVIRLLHDLGVDLTKPCDAMGYGAPVRRACTHRQRCSLRLQIFSFVRRLPGVFLGLLGC